MDVRSGPPSSPSWKQPRGDLVTRRSNLSYAPTFLPGIAGMMLSDVVMALQHNVPRWTCYIGDDGMWQVV